MIRANFTDLVGHTLGKVERVEEYGSDKIVFVESAGVSLWKMGHQDDCCEDVHIEEIIGDFDDLIGTPILKATEHANQKRDTGESDMNYYDWVYRWTFYDISTIKGTVTIRWYGESNGYYSVDVGFGYNDPMHLEYTWWGVV